MNARTGVKESGKAGRLSPKVFQWTAACKMKAHRETLLSELESLVEMLFLGRPAAPLGLTFPSLSVTLAGDPNTQGKLIMGSAHPRLWNPI
jgi:hypothetical protein